jgi:hypothetical protein
VFWLLVALTGVADGLFGDLMMLVALPALASSRIATVTAWLYLPGRAAPLVPVLCLGSGASVGLFTPVLSTGPHRRHPRKRSLS